MIAESTEVPIFVNGVLLSRRYITSESGVAITTSNVSSIKLNVYQLVYDESGNLTRDVVDNYEDVSLPVASVISDEVQTDSDGNNYNFQYCVEGAFTLPNQRYCIEYTLLMADTHTVIIAIYGQTLD